MKKILCVLFVLTALVAVIVIGGCDIYNPVIDEWWIGETPEETTEEPPDTTRAVIPITTYTVTFNMPNGGKYFDANDRDKTTVSPQVLKDGALVSEPGLVIWDDDNDGYHDTSANKFFAGWWTARESGGERWVFSRTIVNADADLLDGNADGIIPLYARWSDSGYTVNFYPGGEFDGNPGTGAGDIDFTKTTYPVEPEYVASGVELSQPKDFGLKPDDPLASSYAFTGWYIDVNTNEIVDLGDIRWDFNTPVTGDMKLYAGWGGGAPTPVYTVTFNDDGADNPNLLPKLIPDEEVLDDNKVSRPDVIYKNGYTFDGWYKDDNHNGIIDVDAGETEWDFDDSVTAVTGDMDLVAKWEQNPPTSYTVNFNMQGGEYFDAVNGNSPDIKSQQLTPNQLVQEPGLVIIDSDNDNKYDTPPTKFFAGWWTAPETGGTLWKFNDDHVDATTDAWDGAADGTINLYARWTTDTSIGNTVTFNSNGDFDYSGTITGDEIDFSKTTYTPEPEYVADDVTLAQPKGFGLDPDKAPDLANKYAFTGWYTDIDGDGILDKNKDGILEPTEARKWDFNTDTVSDNITLYAGWGTRTATGGVITPENGGIPIPAYTVTFNDNDDNPATSVPDEVVVSGNKVPKPDTIYKDEYAFTGWYKDSACTTPWDFNTPVTEADDIYLRRGVGTNDNSFTLYAGWEPIPYTDPWFDEKFGLYTVKDSGKQYIPFQCDPGMFDWGGFDNNNAGDSDANYENFVDKVIPLLKNHPSYIARIVGYEDNDGDKLNLKREAATWDILTTETGVNPDQVILNTKLPPGTDKESEQMIIAPNASAGVVVPGGDEVEVYIYIPTN